MREHDPAAAELADRVAEITYLLADLAADVASYAGGLETDPARLAAVSERRAALAALTRKYGETVDEVLAWAETSAARLARARRHRRADRPAPRQRDDLRGRARAGGRWRSPRPDRAAAPPRRASPASSTRWRCRTPCSRSWCGRRAADDGPRSVGGALRFGRRASTRWSSCWPPTRQRAAPLAKGASGGELSRVMLALEVALAGTGPVPTFVFDEVDAGVGGAAAVEVGRRLAGLAKSAQVLVVTHLPQVAAYADRHVVVEKTSDGTVTSSGLTVLDDAGRERELSRMMAGMRSPTPRSPTPASCSRRPAGHAPAARADAPGCRSAGRARPGWHHGASA